MVELEADDVNDRDRLVMLREYPRRFRYTNPCKVFTFQKPGSHARGQRCSCYLIPQTFWSVVDDLLSRGKKASCRHA